MTGRERVSAAVEHRRVDRIPTSDSFWEDTLIRWYKEGFPEGVAPERYFNFDIYPMSVDPSPGFKASVLEEDERFTTLRDRFGYVAKKQKGVSRTLEYLSYPATDSEMWRKVSGMFTRASDELATCEETRIDNEGFPFRVSPVPTWDVALKKFKTARVSEYYILAHAYGPHEATWRLRGFTETLVDLALDKEFIREIATTYVSHLIAVLAESLDRGFRFDGFMMIDDVAATRGMLFSPETWRSVYKPLVAEIGSFLRKHGVHFWMHGCGNAEVIYDDLIDCGLQVYNPLEAKSGLNVVELFEKYRGRLAFHGNIDATVMSGTDEEIEEEIRSKVGAVGCDGGYIYHSDHSVPPEVSFDRYRFIMDRVGYYGACT